MVSSPVRVPLAGRCSHSAGPPLTLFGKRPTSVRGEGTHFLWVESGDRRLCGCDLREVWVLWTCMSVLPFHLCLGVCGHEA